MSAGNAGPGAATAQGGAPWYTTVAASTSPTFEATVRLSDGFEAPGVSVSVRDGDAVSAPVVYAGDAALDGSADAHLCYLGTLDPAVVDGRIVVCDRGTNPRSEKSQEVADAGGVGHDPGERHTRLARRRLPRGPHRAHRRGAPRRAAGREPSPAPRRPWWPEI